MAILETRVISGRGLLRLDTSDDDYKKAKVFTLYVDVIRRPRNEYLNITYNEPQSRYGVIRLYRGAYCVQTIPIETLHQAFDFYLDPAAQAMYAVQCAYAGMLQSYVNLGIALGATPISVTNNIEDWQAVDLMWDEAKVVCYADTGIRLSVRTTSFDLCPEQEDKDKDPPPPPPEDQPEVPPGEPLNDNSIPVSPPYEGDNDNGDTVPFPEDTPPEPEFPAGIRCNTYTVSVSIVIGDGSITQENTIVIFGEIEFVGVDPSNPLRVIIVCHGDALAPGASCNPSPVTIQLIGSSIGFIENSFVYSIAPY